MNIVTFYQDESSKVHHTGNPIEHERIRCLAHNFKH